MNSCHNCKYASVPLGAEPCGTCCGESRGDGTFPKWEPRELPPLVTYTPGPVTSGDAPKAATYDDGKPPLARLPWKGLAVVAKVQAYGHRKYGDFDNYRKGMEIGRNLSCAMRHISDYMEGQDNDPESGESHLGHAAARVLFVLQNIADGVAIDDRYKRPA